MPAFAAVHLCSCLVALPAATHPLMIAVPTAQPNLAQVKETFAKECANSQCFKVVAAPRKAAAAGKPTAAAQAAADQPADGVAGDGKAEAKPAADQAAGGLRNVDHREFLNLCHNWQKASAGLRIEGGQRWAVPAHALQFASFAHCPMRVLSVFQRRHPCPSPLPSPQKLTDEVFSSCLQSGDYMQAKNALLALNRCVRVRGRWAGQSGAPALCAPLMQLPAFRQSCNGSPGLTHSMASNRSMHWSLPPQVYPATKLDATRLIDILAPIR